jgi:tetratricopeptide (TPR) repeat protein
MGGLTMNPRQQAQYLTNQAFAVVSRALQANRQGEFELGRRLLAESLEPLDLALQADPTYEHAHNERAFVLGQLQREEEAAESARKAISLMPHVPKFRMALIGIGLKKVQLQDSRGKRRSAAEDYRSAIGEITKMFPRYPSGFLAQAEFQALTGVGQSFWEESLSNAAKAYFSMSKMSSGEPATEAAVAEALKANTWKCLELAREWDRLRD